MSLGKAFYCLVHPYSALDGFVPRSVAVCRLERSTPADTRPLATLGIRGNVFPSC